MANIVTQKYYATSSGSEKLEEIDEEEQLMWQSEHQQRRHNYNHDDEEDYIEEEDEDDDEDDDEEDDLMIEDASSMSSSPSIPDENINFDLVYALHTFVATVEGQASVVKGDALILMEDTNIYWWLVEVLKTREVGYIPAENIETPYERLARLNKHRNVEITSPSIHDIAPLPVIATHPLHSARRVTIGDEACSQIFHYEVESDIEEDDEEVDHDHIEHVVEDYEEEEDNQTQNQAVAKRSSEFQEIKYDYDVDDNKKEIMEEAPASEKELIQSNEEWQEKKWESEVSPVAPITMVSQPVDSAQKEEEEQKMDLRVFAGNIGQGPLFHSFSVVANTTADELIKIAVNRFGVLHNTGPSENTTIEYYLAVQGMDGDEYILSAQDKPFSIFKTLTDSLTTPMPSLTHIKRISQQSMSSTLSTSSRRPRSSSFSNYEQTSYDEDSVIRFYLHRRIKRAIEREGLLYIKVSLYPDETAITTITPQPQVPVNSAFIKNPTPNIRLINKKRRQQQQQQQKSEIDRIDKIIAVRKDYSIGVVIKLALEKFHVPDVQETNDPQNGTGENSRQLGKYRMSVRSNNQETDLNPNEIMSNVLLEQQNITPNHHGGPITSDLLFVLRKSSDVKQSQKQRHASNASNNNKSLPSQLLTTNMNINEDRRPSILDILMDTTPKFMGERRPSVMSSLLDPLPPTRFAEDNGNNINSNNNNNINNRRPSGQEPKSSLNNINSQHSPSSLSSSSFPTSKSPVSIVTGYNNRRSSIQSSSIISTSTSSILATEEHTLNNNSNIHPDLMDHIVEITPTSSSSTMTRSTQPSTSNSTETNTKKKESFKQQFKRFVGWGSSSSASSPTTNKKNLIPPPLTTSMISHQGMNSNMDSPSDISFVSAPSTPLPPTPGTPRSFATKSRQGSQQLHGESKLIMEVNSSSTPNSTLSRKTSETNHTLSDPSAAAMAAAAAIGNNNRLSTVSSVSTLSTSSVTSEELAEAAKKGIDIDAESEDEEEDELESEEIKKVVEETAVADPQVTTAPKENEPLPSTVTQTEEPEDIQAQYALWMNSQPPTTTNVVNNESNNNPALNSALANKALPPIASTATTSPVPAPSTSTATTNTVPAKNPLRNKSSNISNMTNTTVSHCATPSIISTTTTAATTIVNHKEETLHPMPPVNNGGKEDLDDLFLLVAHGVDFLTSRENTKWEEEGGYEFHPWNRPQSSFAVQPKEQRHKKDIPPLPVNSENNVNAGDVPEEEDVEGHSSNGTSGSTSAALAMARSLLLSSSAPSTPEEQDQQLEQNKPISPPLTPLPQQQQDDQQQQQQQQQQSQEAHLSLAKRILSGKNEVPVVSAPAQPQSQQSVDDEELQRIVAAHIVF